MLSEARNETAPPRRRVLVVDDDPDFAESLYNFLTLEGYEVERAHSAGQALEAIERFDAQVAILDYRLGQTIGVDLVKPLERRRPGIICLLATAHADMNTAVKALRHGIHDYFGKPLNTDELIAALERCFEMIRLKEAQAAAQAALREAEKMKAVGQMAGGVAHHFNNLLMIILANAERLKLCIKDDSEALALTENLEDAVDRAAEINRNLMSYTRQTILRPKIVALDVAVSEALEALGDELGSIRVEVAVQSDLWNVHVDPAQCEASLCAILRNAVEAMAGGGKLTVEAANTVLPESGGPTDLKQGEDSFVVVTVTDDGAGMPPEVARRAFEPFYSHRSLAEKMGLGLSTAYGFAAQSGGRITLDSREGHGTTVKLALPRFREPGKPEG
ncbi:MAG: response regulator [Rhodospirillales bacterium]|nr:response regulator [Rhodospirillales bacterium]